MSSQTKRRIRWYHITIITVIALLLILLSPVYPARVFSAKNGQTLVAITLDDGYSCWNSEVMPDLAQYNMVASAYITDPDLRTDFTWADAQQLNSAGWEIGWHTVSHQQLTTLTPSQITNDFDQAAPMFEAHGLPAPVTFAYPSGSHDSVAMKIASKYFLASRTMEYGVNTPPDVQKNPQHLKQFSMERGLSYLEKKVKEYSGQDVLVVLAGHTVGEIAPWQKKPDMSVSDFKALAQFLYQQEQAGTIEVVTLKEGVQRLLQEPFSASWHLVVHSPFDTWFHFWIIPVPERYYMYFQAVVQDDIGHRFPAFSHWFKHF